MIDMIEFIPASLSSLGLPVFFHSCPAGTTPPYEYITFLEYGSSPELETGDNESSTERLIQVNVWSKGNYHQLVQNVREALEQSGFERTFEFDSPYEDGDSHFNKVLRFRFIDEY